MTDSHPFEPSTRGVSGAVPRIAGLAEDHPGERKRFSCGCSSVPLRAGSRAESSKVMGLGLSATSLSAPSVPLSGDGCFAFSESPQAAASSRPSLENL